jgi:hypothetical protein
MEEQPNIINQCTTAHSATTGRMGTTTETRFQQRPRQQQQMERQTFNNNDNNKDNLQSQWINNHWINNPTKTQTNPQPHKVPYLQDCNNSSINAPPFNQPDIQPVNNNSTINSPLHTQLHLQQTNISLITPHLLHNHPHLQQINTLNPTPRQFNNNNNSLTQQDNARTIALDVKQW